MSESSIIKVSVWTQAGWGQNEKHFPMVMVSRPGKPNRSHLSVTEESLRRLSRVIPKDAAAVSYGGAGDSYVWKETKPYHPYGVGLTKFTTLREALAYAEEGDWWFVHYTSPRWVDRLYDVREGKWLTYDDMIEILLEMND